MSLPSAKKLLLGSPRLKSPVMVIFTASQAGYKVPRGARKAKIECLQAGQDGAFPGDSNASRGKGGKGGDYAARFDFDVSKASSIDVTVGASNGAHSFTIINGSTVCSSASPQLRGGEGGQGSSSGTSAEAPAGITPARNGEPWSNSSNGYQFSTGGGGAAGPFGGGGGGTPTSSIASGTAGAGGASAAGEFAGGGGGYGQFGQRGGGGGGGGGSHGPGALGADYTAGGGGGAGGRGFNGTPGGNGSGQVGTLGGSGGGGAPGGGGAGGQGGNSTSTSPGLGARGEVRITFT